MTGNIQREEGFVSEHISVLWIIKLALLFTAKKINLQKILYFTAFLTFGVGDGITAAYMMDRLGVGIESNPFARYLFMTQGFWGLVMAKVWIATVILFATYMVNMRSPDSMYWSINGFLAALTAGGMMATNANLTAMAGEIPQAPGEIIFIYLGLVLTLTEIGSFVDRRVSYQWGHDA